MKSNLTLTMAGESQTAGHGCGCGCGTAEAPRLRVTDLPKQIRHGAIIGGLVSLSAGDQLVLVAPHDPKPLLAQLTAEHPDTFGVRYLADGPDEWQLEFTRR